MNVMSLEKHWNEIFSLQIWLGLNIWFRGGMRSIPIPLLGWTELLLTLVGGEA